MGYRVPHLPLQVFQSRLVTQRLIFLSQRLFTLKTLKDTVEQETRNEHEEANRELVDHDEPHLLRETGLHVNATWAPC
jgi:hypothetical protein